MAHLLHGACRRWKGVIFWIWGGEGSAIGARWRGRKMRVIVGGSRVGKGADELGFVSEAKAGASLEDESVDEKAKGHVVVDRVSTMDLLGFDRRWNVLW